MLPANLKYLPAIQQFLPQVKKFAKLLRLFRFLPQSPSLPTIKALESLFHITKRSRPNHLHKEMQQLL